MPTDADLFEALRAASTATLTTVLLKRGLRNVWMRGTRPLRANQGRAVGRAFTMRFVPAREDLATPAAWTSPTSTRAAVEAMPPGCFVVADAMRSTDAGVFGDILCARMAKRRVAGLVTDGALRDLDGVRNTVLPVWASGAAAPPAVAALTFVDWQNPVGCGGVAVFPGDIVVADGDGAVLIPAAIAEAVAVEAPEQERAEAWILHEIERGAPLPGLYPMNPETAARYRAQTS